jgi:3-oxoacyl-[acyl-carrier protein] reductase
MLLKDKIAVVYGAGGAVGAAVARTYAREGAHVFLAGRTRTSVDVIADAISAGAGVAEAAEVDALDDAAVNEHMAAVEATAGRLDIAFNAIGIPQGDIQGTSLLELSPERSARRSPPTPEHTSS